MKINKATVLIGKYRADLVILHTDFPCPFVKEFCPQQENLGLQFETTKGNGAEYVRKNFGIEPEVIDIDKG